MIRGTSAGHIVLSNDVVAAVTGTSLTSIDSVAAGGTGYVVGELITLTGGTSTIDAVIEVLTLSGSAVATARIYNQGVYTVAPGDPVAQGSSDGSGTGATFNLTFATNGWTAERDTTWSGSERDVILNGSGGGSDDIYVGWRTFQNAGASRYNWELHGFTGFDSGLDHQNQPGISPGDHESVTTSIQNGTYLPLSNASLEYWINVTSYHIILTVKVGSNYFHASLGFLNRYATSSEYPYPLLIAGSASDADATAVQSQKMSTLTDPWVHTSISNNGPMVLIRPDGSWDTIGNASINGSSLNPASAVFITLPCGQLSATTNGSTPEQDRFMATSIDFAFSEFIRVDSLSAPDSNLHQTPGTADEIVLFPVMLVAAETNGNNPFFPGEIDDVFWISAFGGILAEDRIIKDGEVYRIFPNCNRTNVWEFLAIKEVG